jgi:protein TonB
VSQNIAVAASPLTPPPSRGAVDPVLGSVLDFGRDEIRVGWGVGLGAAAIVYGYVLVRLATALLDMADWVEDSRRGMDEYFFREYEVETEKKEEKKEEEKKEEPKAEEPEPVVNNVAATPPPPNVPRSPQPTNPNTPPPTDPYEEPKGGGGEITDRTGDGTYEHAAGSGDGVGSGTGKGFGTGTGGGKGDKPAAPPPPPPPPPPPAVDKSAPPTLVGSKSWNCPFPPEADAAGKDSAVVQLVVTVGASGSPEGAQVLADPGTGFGRAAKTCALGRKYKAGLDRDGNPTRAKTPPITVRFSR